MIYTTLNKIRACGPCGSGWQKLLKYLGKTEADDEPLPFATIVKSNGLNDALWCCRAAPEHDREWRLYAIWCARQVQHLMVDRRSIAAIDVAERYANGAATRKELIDAWAAAWTAARGAAEAASDSAWAASDSAWAAAWTCSEAAMDSAWDAVRDASWAASWAAAGATNRATHTKKFLEIVG